MFVSAMVKEVRLASSAVSGVFVLEPPVGHGGGTLMSRGSRRVELDLQERLLGLRDAGMNFGCRRRRVSLCSSE